MAAITTGEILWKYSVSAGSAGNSTAGSAATTWQGKYASNVNWAGGGTNDLFDDVTGAENAAATIVDYRGLAIHNSNTANPLQSAVAYLSAEVAGGASISIAADSVAASAVGSASAQMVQATSEAAPGTSVTSLTYSAPTTATGGVSLGTITNGFVKGLWVRRTSSNSAALSTDGVTLAVAGDSGSL